MPYPNFTASMIVISQTNNSASAGPGQFPFVERQISGSELILITDSNGILTGSKSINSFTASVISASNVISGSSAWFNTVGVGSSVTIGQTLTVNGNISSSGNVSGSNAWFNNLTVNNTIVGSVQTASIANGLNASNTYSMSGLFNSGNTFLGNETNDILRITASVSLSGSTLQTGSINLTGNITSSGISSSGAISASGIFVNDTIYGPGANTYITLNSSTIGIGTSLNVIGSATVGSFLTVNGNISGSGTLTASNAWFGGNVSSSTAWFNNLTVNNTIIGTVQTASIANGLNASNVYSMSGLFNTGNTFLGNSLADILRITSSINLSGSITMSGNLSGSNTISASYGWFDSLFANTFTGSVSGSITNAASASVAALDTTNGTYYLTFVDGVGARPLYIDQATLTWNPSTNALSSSGDLTVNDINVNGGDIKTTANSLLIASSGSVSSVVIGNTATEVQIDGNLFVTNGATASLATTTGSIVTNGGVYIGKNLIVSGSSTFYGDVTMFGTGSVINISSSTVIIGDNRIQLNTFSQGGGNQRYAGLDLVDSGSGQSNAVTSSLLWDSLNNYWLLQTNQSGSSPIVTSSAIILQGPTSSFGSEFLLTVNNFLKVQTTTGNMITSSLSETGIGLEYRGTISASIISSSAMLVSGRLSAATGSFNNITLVTGSNPGDGSIYVPQHPTASGMAGQIEVDNNFIYVYTNNTWKRVPLAMWSL